jgi:hypothetical protein
LIRYVSVPQLGLEQSASSMHKPKGLHIQQMAGQIEEASLDQKSQS